MSDLNLYLPLIVVGLAWIIFAVGVIVLLVSRVKRRRVSDENGMLKMGRGTRIFVVVSFTIFVVGTVAAWWMVMKQ